MLPDTNWMQYILLSYFHHFYHCSLMIFLFHLFWCFSSNQSWTPASLTPEKCKTVRLSQIASCEFTCWEKTITSWKRVMGDFRLLKIVWEFFVAIVSYLELFLPYFEVETPRTVLCCVARWCRSRWLLFCVPRWQCTDFSVAFWSGGFGFQCANQVLGFWLKIHEAQFWVSVGVSCTVDIGPIGLG